ncbi:unnamed protein product [Symbiodinium natans]|uniref:Uncharacterized protein n=1 Tax=Symbiodinium natans TaxID=878477 RepID=A0A812JZW2_9DINO|nr:unnamed protein product [Symbiodinium natans]
MSESIDATSDIDQDLPAELPELQFRAEPADLASAPRLCLEEERHQPSPRTTSSSSSIVGRVEQTSSIEPIRRISQEVPGPIDAHAARGSIDSAADAESESETSLSQGAPGIEPAGSKPAERAEARSGDGSSEIDELEACTSPANLYTAAETAHVALEGPTTAASSTEHGAVASIHGQTVEDGRGRKAEDESSYTYEESFSDPGSSTPRQREEEESLSEDASSEQDLVVALEDIESSSGSSSGRRPRRTEQPRILETE